MISFYFSSSSLLIYTFFLQLKSLYVFCFLIFCCSFVCVYLSILLTSDFSVISSVIKHVTHLCLSLILLYYQCNICFYVYFYLVSFYLFPNFKYMFNQIFQRVSGFQFLQRRQKVNLQPSICRQQWSNLLPHITTVCSRILPIRRYCILILY